jgi:hypothetical protein
MKSPTKQVEQEFQRYFEAFCSVLLTEVFVTNNGYLGRSQPGVTKGDEVYIVSGRQHHLFCGNMTSLDIRRGRDR